MLFLTQNFNPFNTFLLQSHLHTRLPSSYRQTNPTNLTSHTFPHTRNAQTINFFSLPMTSRPFPPIAEGHYEQEVIILLVPDSLLDKEVVVMQGLFSSLTTLLMGQIRNESRMFYYNPDFFLLVNDGFLTQLGIYNDTRI